MSVTVELAHSMGKEIDRMILKSYQDLMSAFFGDKFEIEGICNIAYTSKKHLLIDCFKQSIVLTTFYGVI